MKRPFDEVEKSRLNRRPTTCDSLRPPTPCSNPARTRLSANRLLQRSFGSLMTYSNLRLGVSPLDSVGFYSRPDEVRTNGENGSNVPFAVACANTCSLTALGDESGVVKVFDHTPLERAVLQTSLFELQPHRNAVFHAEWSHNDKILAVASGDQKLTFVDVPTQAVTSVLAGGSSTVKDIKFCPSNPNICTTGARDGLLAVWDLRTSYTSALKPMICITATDSCSTSSSIGGNKRRSYKTPISITALLYKSDGKIISACASDTILRTWDLRYARTDSPETYGSREYPLLEQSSPIPTRNFAESQIQAGQTPAISGSHERRYGITSLAMSHDQQRFYAMNKNHKILEYPTSHSCTAPTNVFECATLSIKTFYCKISISSDGLLLCGNASGSPVIIDSNHRRSYNRFQSLSSPQVSLASLRASQDQENLPASPMSSIEAQRCPTDSPSDLKPAHRSLLKNKNLDQNGSSISRQLNGGHVLECTGTSWSHDSSSFVTIGDDSLVRIWRRDERRSGKEVMEVEGGVSSDWGWL